MDYYKTTTAGLPSVKATVMEHLWYIVKYLKCTKTHLKYTAFGT